MKSIIDRSSLSLICLPTVTGSLPLIRVIEGTTAVIQIPAADWDTTDDVRCRWALASGPAGNECGDVCANVPGASLSARYGLFSCEAMNTDS